MQGLLRRSCTHSIRRCLYNDSQATKAANLGAMTEYLSSEAVPYMLNTTLKPEVLDREIKLRLLPTQHSYWPTISGRTKYKHSMTAIGLIVRTLMLHNHSILHVSGVETISGTSKGRRYNTITENDKVVIHWHSCKGDSLEMSPEDQASQAKSEASDIHRNNSTKREGEPRLDPSHAMWQYILNPGQKFSQEMFSQNNLKADRESSRTIYGIFVFELNHDNTRVLVHTIDNAEFSEKPKKHPTGALAC
ncbi:LADA_0C11122g1_1 [Lachancea dasiensis]|uniref:LADA_0C11122g1_1 n=1 Tax=Lachancea dasiensis TaxID=1072105 RepID=A0A1G4J1G9_9SACH|nr:LADA_0C11122g1_1 [Lachancea dasiensis]